jgi:hypothetical protein
MKSTKSVKTATKGKMAPGLAKYAGPATTKKAATTAKTVAKVAPSKAAVGKKAAPVQKEAAKKVVTKTKKEKKERVRIWSPPGRFSFPWLATPDSGRTYSDDAYKSDLFILKPTWKEYGDALKEAVLQVGRDAFGTKFKFGGQWRTPFKDTDKDDKIVDETQKNCILIRAKSKPARSGRFQGVARQPVVFGPRKDSKGNFPQLTLEEIEAIKGGDWGKLMCDVFAYDQSGGGVTFGLSAVQFWKEGDPFGQGLARLMETVEELEEEEVDEVDEDEVDEAEAEEDESEEDEDESDEDEEAEEDESEEDSDDEEEEVEEDEEEDEDF